MVRFVLMLAALVAPTLAWAANLTGTWRGAWVKNGDAVPVVMTFARTASVYTGYFGSDALQAAGIPIIHIADADGKVGFEVNSDEGTTAFQGVVAGDALSGTFKDGAETGRFEFTRAAPEKPAFRTEDVTFRDGEVTLAGTLVLPLNSGRHAAVAFLQGSGPEGRWANRYLAEAFARAGIAALIYDKRGVGQSSGDWRTVGFDALADDGAAAVGFLRARLEVDPARVGVYGHSQGGTITPLVAARAPGLGFIIASAAGGLDPAAVETYSVGNSIGLDGLAPAERADARAYLDAVIDVAYRGQDRAALDALAARFKTRPWYFDPPPPGNSYWTLSRKIAAFRPAEAWLRVKVPVLLVYGAHDQRVPPRAGAEAITAALKAGGQPPPTVKLYPDADHIFTIVDPAKKGGWPKREPDYAATLIGWVKGLG